MDSKLALTATLMFKLRMLLAAICLLFVLSCSKEIISCFTPPEPTFIRLLDRNGVDLLDPSNPNGYKLSATSMYYMENGGKVLSPVKLDSQPNGNMYYLNTEISWNADGGREFFLTLSPTITDKIYLRYDAVSERKCSFFKLLEFKYNDVAYTKKKITGNLEAYEIVRECFEVLGL